MKRHYFISEDLSELEDVERELEDHGVSPPQIHVLSEDDAAVSQHNLHEVESLMRKDVVHSVEAGAVVGVTAAVAVLAGAYFLGLTDTAAGWLPFFFLSIVVLGFCAWEGGLFGIQEPHRDFKRFQEALSAGKHIFFVDVDAAQESILRRILNGHPQLTPAGVGDPAPQWFVSAQQKWRRFVRWAP